MERASVRVRLSIAVCAVVLALGLTALPGVPVPVSAQPGEGGDRTGGGQQEPQPGSNVIGDGVVIPGQRIGPIRLTMPIDAMIAAVGRRPKRDEIPADGIILYEWRAEGVWISQALATKSVRVVSVFGTSDRYKTDKNVSLLQTRSRVEAVYGKGYKEYDYAPDRITLIRYHDIGLQFGLVNQPSNPTIHGRVFQIGIFKPGELPLLRRPTR